MKYLPYVVIAVLILFIVFRPARVEHVSGEVVRDTVTVIDTVRDTVPKPYRVEVMRMDTFYLPIFVGDSLEVDSVPVVFSIEKKEYKTNEYRAVISGFHPNLDFIETYNKSKIVTVVSRKKRWGIGLQLGYGYPSGFYVGGGISDNIWSW